MQFRRFEDVSEFHKQIAPFLLEKEAQHCLMLGLLTSLTKTNIYEEPPYLAYVERNGNITAVVMRTPPFNLILSEMVGFDALPLIAEQVHQTYPALPGVLGPKAAVERFAPIWQKVSGQTYRHNMQERIYRLEQVQSVKGVNGKYGTPTATDRELLIKWLVDFEEEALGFHTHDRVEKQVDNKLTSDPELTGWRIWRDEGEPVSLVGYGGRTENGMRIGPVYTPRELRGHGYASACVAATSQELLDKGRKFCFLFTDLSNPTSNHIYQNIGYEPISYVDEYRFGDSRV